MTDNEKAAIAAGLWEPGLKCHRVDAVIEVNPPIELECRKHGVVYVGYHDIPAPDMQDAANLWRALERLTGDGWVVTFGVDPYDCSMMRAYTLIGGGRLFAVLVALYDDSRRR